MRYRAALIRRGAVEPFVESRKRIGVVLIAPRYFVLRPPPRGVILGTVIDIVLQRLNRAAALCLPALLLGQSRLLGEAHHILHHKTANRSLAGTLSAKTRRQVGRETVCDLPHPVSFTGLLAASMGVGNLGHSVQRVVALLFHVAEQTARSILPGYLLALAARISGVLAGVQPVYRLLYGDKLHLARKLPEHTRHLQCGSRVVLVLRESRHEVGHKVVVASRLSLPHEIYSARCRAPCHYVLAGLYYPLTRGRL